MVVEQDFIVDGRGMGEVGSVVANSGFDVGLQRPYFTKNAQGKTRDCVTANIAGKPKILVRSHAESRGLRVVNAATLLRKDAWLELDRAVLKISRERLRAWSDLESASSFNFDGYGKMILEWETMSDSQEAIVDMDGIAEGRSDNPTFQLEGLPLPLTHSSFWYSDRRLAISQNSGTPLDTASAEHAARKVAESVEKTLIGVDAGIQYGVTADYGQTPKVWGYITQPQINLKADLTTPDGTNAATTLGEVLTMIQTLAGDNYFGPFMLYHSTLWDEFMDDDYVAASPQNTLRERLRKIDAISDVRRLDFFTSSVFGLVLVQMTSDVARAVTGMEMVTVQWPSKGGAQQNFKVMTIKVPQIRADNAGNSGIIYGSNA